MRIGVPEELQGIDRKADEILELIGEQLGNSVIKPEDRGNCLRALREYIVGLEERLDGNDWDWEHGEITESDRGVVSLGFPSHGVDVIFSWADGDDMARESCHLGFNVVLSGAVSQFGITEGAPQPELERPRSRLDRYMDDFYGRPY